MNGSSQNAKLVVASRVGLAYISFTGREAGNNLNERYFQMATETVKNYSTEQEALIRGFKGTGEGGKLTPADVSTMAADARMNTADGKPRSVKSLVAKISRMDIPYERKVPTRKDGSKVQTKADIVAEIAAKSGLTFENLTVAARGDLVGLRDWIVSKAA